MSFPREPFVSVITPLFNGARFIEEAIKSVQNQIFSDWEMIVVDDGSSDGSPGIVERFIAEDSRIILLKTGYNSGPAVARNTGIKHARGRYIAFLDSDDMWLPHKLETQIKIMQRYGYVFTFSSYCRVDTFGRQVDSIGVPDVVSYHDLLKTCYIGCLTAVYDSKYFGKVEMPIVACRQDYGLWLSLLKKTRYAYGINQSLALYRIRPDSISFRKKNVALYNWFIYRKVEGLSLISSFYYFSHYAARGLLRARYPKLARKLGVLHNTGE